MADENNPIYVIASGAPRSGTTFLEQLLNSHENVFCLHEYGLARFVNNVSGLFLPEHQDEPDWNIMQSERTPDDGGAHESCISSILGRTR